MDKSQSLGDADAADGFLRTPIAATFYSVESEMTVPSESRQQVLRFASFSAVRM